MALPIRFPSTCRTLSRSACAGGSVGTTRVSKREPLLPDERGAHLVHVSDHARRRRSCVGSSSMARALGPGVGEDLLDHRQELAARADDRSGRPPLPRVDLPEQPVAEDLAVGDDRGERRAELVRDVGEELGLRHVEIAQLAQQHAPAPRSATRPRPASASRRTPRRPCRSIHASISDSTANPFPIEALRARGDPPRRRFTVTLEYVGGVRSFGSWRGES